MYFFTTSLISLAILRLIHGIGFGMITTSTGTIVASLSLKVEKGKGWGIMGLMMNISMALGPFVGLLAINQWGSTMMFAVSARKCRNRYIHSIFNFSTERRKKGTD